ncbi:MAG: sensor histidine kinase [Candidatus Thorarchaeota archaeon]
MQLVSIEGTLVIVLLEGLIAFITMVTYLLLRHAKRKQFKYWAIGWIVYTIGITISLLEISQTIGLLDGFALAGILASTLILYDGTTRNFRKGWNNLIYVILGIVGFVLCLLFIPVGIHFSILFAPLSIPLLIVLLLTAQELYAAREMSSIMIRISIVGILLWAGSVLITPITSFSPVLYVMVIVQSSALLVTGCGLLGLFTEITQKDLNKQHILSETLSGLIQHDIRNFIQIALSALEMAKISEGYPDQMMELALESLQDASVFVHEMRTIASALSKSDSQLRVIDIHETFTDIKRRVSREYDFGDGRISVFIPAETYVLSVDPVRELIWNIVDNAFKHGSSKILVKVKDFSDSKLTLSITDNAGGMKPAVKRFINDGGLSIGNTIPGVGLGLTLINRLAPVCGIKIQVEDNINDSEVNGTIFLLTFDKPQDQEKK